MSQKQPPDFKSQSKRRRTKSERTATDLAKRPSEYKNRRLKSKRAASPTPSYLSMRTDWSMDPPTNFKGGDTFPLHSRIKRKRETSPVTSYISLKSDNPVNDSRGNTSMPRVRAASPTPTCLSVKTDWSMEPPTNFRAAETFPLDPRLLTEHHLRCPLCKSMLKDPVSIPCGHNYCRGCINEFWDNCAGDYVCPQCGNPSETRPVLNTNAALAEVVKNLQQAGFSPALPPQSYAGPEDVACDFCTDDRLKAVKCCSTCGVSLCETHVKQHYTIPALQKHTLSDVTVGMKMRPSQQHQNTDNSFSSTSGQQDQTDKTLTFDIMKEMAVRSIFESVLKPARLQTQPKRSAKPKTRDNKEVRSLALVCSTLKQEVSGLKKRLSKISKRKNTKKEKHYEKDFGKEEDEDCSEKDSDERSDDEGRDDSSDEEEDGSENSSDEEEDGSENSSDEEEDDSENSSDEEEDDSENSSDEEEDGSENSSDEEDGEEDGRDDEEDNSAYSDEGSDDKYSEGYNDHSSEEYNSEDEDYDY